MGLRDLVRVPLSPGTSQPREHCVSVRILSFFSLIHSAKSHVVSVLCQTWFLPLGQDREGNTCSHGASRLVGETNGVYVRHGDDGQMARTGTPTPGKQEGMDSGRAGRTGVEGSDLGLRICTLTPPPPRSVARTFLSTSWSSVSSSVKWSPCATHPVGLFRHLWHPVMTICPNIHC